MSKVTKKQLPVRAIMFPKWKFHIELMETKNAAGFGIREYYCIGKARNGETLFTWESRKHKDGLIKTINNCFPQIKIIDKTK